LQASNYSVLDRAVHRLAFGTKFAQQVLCDLEERLYGEDIRRQPVEAPIFITALPRAGTTLLLQVLSRHPDVVTHTYRDMPFVLSPVIWGRLSRKFQIELTPSERSHSDGVMVNADSPEAFEEVLWLRQFPETFRASGLTTCGDDAGQRIWEPLADLIRRLIASRGHRGPGTPRYLSKNNANIARIPALQSAFPHARIIVPLRAPLDHALSMHRQHMRYLDIHRASGFAEAYMNDIGHFEFGRLHRPILFDGMKEVIASHDPATLDYWLAYWIVAYGHISRQSDIEILDMGAFTSSGDLAPTLDVLHLRHNQETLDAARDLVRPIRHYDTRNVVSPALLAEATALHEELGDRSKKRT
jgi:hypothetical protein